MRILFIGAVRFSLIMLEQLISLKANIIGGITKETSSYNTDFCDLSSVFIKYKIPFKFVKNINHEKNIEWIKSHKPDVIFCFGWSSLLNEEILAIAPLGVIGYHPALLPENKGRHPLIWAKVLGLPESGSTFFFMDKNADSGDILSQRKFTISFEDDAGVLYKKMTDTALLQLDVLYAELLAGTYHRRKQNIANGNSWRKRGKEDGRIDFRMTTASICNLVRALTHPYVGAHCCFNGREIKVWKVMPGDGHVRMNEEPGKVLSVENGMIEVKTSDGSIFLSEFDCDEMPIYNDYFI